jgi:hypothetical protein
LIKYKSTATRNPAHSSLLTAVGSKFEFVGLIALHATILNPALVAHNTIIWRKDLISAAVGVGVREGEKPVQPRLVRQVRA